MTLIVNKAPKTSNKLTADAVVNLFRQLSECRYCPVILNGHEHGALLIGVPKEHGTSVARLLKDWRAEGSGYLRIVLDDIHYRVYPMIVEQSGGNEKLAYFDMVCEKY